MQKGKAIHFWMEEIAVITGIGTLNKYFTAAIHYGQIFLCVCFYLSTVFYINPDYSFHRTDLKHLVNCFHDLLHAPQQSSLQMVMNDNFCFNLKLEDFARLCYRSLSAFKRDFEDLYGISPGKWLIKKRLQYAKHLLTVAGKSVNDAAFESGFENVSHFSRTLAANSVTLHR